MKSFGFRGILGAAATAYSLGQLAHKQLLAERKVLPTWSERPMARPMPVLKSYGRPRPRGGSRLKYGRRSRAGPGKSLGGFFRSLVRTSFIGSTTLTTASFVATAFNIALNVVQTSDLQPVYRVYRIRKVVIKIVPRVDNGNSGISNNFQTAVHACCDPEDSAPTLPANVGAITAFDNSRSAWLTSGGVFKYTFYPKATNSIIGSGGTAAGLGSYGMNPWIRLDNSGIIVPHSSIKVGFQTGANTTITYDHFLDIHFDVKGVS